jgi:V/A-type H+/Na+-transporting ATPase subunit C
MTKIVSKYDYAYSVALVRTLENTLLNENEMERMILSDNAKDAFRILNETDYADNKAGIDNPADFQKVINEGMLDIKEILDNVTPDKRVMHMMWHDFDFHNIKTLIKAKLSGQSYEDVEHLLIKLGAISLPSLKSYIYDGQNVPFGLQEKTEIYIKSRIKKVQELFEKVKNPLAIDLYLDQKMMKMIYNIAVDSKNDFLIRYVKMLIDAHNIRLFFRMKTQEKNLELYDIAFLWNGYIHFRKFKEAYGKSLSEFPEIMKSTAYANIISEGLKSYEEEKTFIYLEKLIEDKLTEYIKQAKLIPFGPEPLIAYFLAKKNNALIIRLIMVSKLNNMDPEEIRKRIRKLYR